MWAYRVERVPLFLVLFSAALQSAAGGGSVLITLLRVKRFRLNNIGTALMSQQLLEKAVDKFGEAYRLDPSLTVAEFESGDCAVVPSTTPGGDGGHCNMLRRRLRNNPRHLVCLRVCFTVATINRCRAWKLFREFSSLTPTTQTVTIF